MIAARKFLRHTLRPQDGHIRTPQLLVLAYPVTYLVSYMLAIAIHYAGHGKSKDN